MRGAWLEGRRLFLPRSRITKFNIHKNIRGAGAGAAEVGEINCLIMKHDIISSGSFHNTNCSVCFNVETF